MTENDPQVSSQVLRTPRAAAIAGILFALLYGSSYILIQLTIPALSLETNDFSEDQARSITLGLSFLPFAGIAFLWFMGVIRERMGALEDQFFSTLFLGSGLLYIGLTFTASAVGGGLLSVELTKSLSDIGILPTVIDRSPYLLRKQLDAEGGLFVNKILDKTLNAKFLFNSVCKRIHRNGEKMKIEIRSKEGDSSHKCEFFLNATGIRNDNSLPLKAGISLGKYAIKVDPFMRTNIENIFAAGDAVDIESFPGSKFGIIPTAVDQAKVAAVNMLGNKLPYTGTVLWTTLKVAGIDLTSIGEVKFNSRVEEVGTINDPEKGVYRKLFFKNQKLQGVIMIGTKMNIHTLRRMTIKHASIKEVKEEISIS